MYHTAYTPQYNGKVERSTRTIVEAVTTMLYSKNLSKTLRGEEWYIVVYLINCKSNTNPEGKTSYVLWINQTLS